MLFKAFKHTVMEKETLRIALKTMTVSQSRSILPCKLSESVPTQREQWPLSIRRSVEGSPTGHYALRNVLTFEQTSKK